MTRRSKLASREPKSGHGQGWRQFHFAEPVIARAILERARGDAALRQALIPMRDLLRPHAFADVESRDGACRIPLPGGVFELSPTTVDDVDARIRTGCKVAIGHRIGEPGFDLVGAAVVDPEITSIVRRWSPSRRNKKAVRLAHRSTVITVAGVHYHLGIDDLGRSFVDAKSAFDSGDVAEMRVTACWLATRLAAYRRDLESRAQAASGVGSHPAASPRTVH